MKRHLRALPGGNERDFDSAATRWDPKAQPLPSVESYVGSIFPNAPEYNLFPELWGKGGKGESKPLTFDMIRKTMDEVRLTEHCEKQGHELVGTRRRLEEMGLIFPDADE